MLEPNPETPVVPAPPVSWWHRLYNDNLLFAPIVVIPVSWMIVPYVSASNTWVDRHGNTSIEAGDTDTAVRTAILVTVFMGAMFVFRLRYWQGCATCEGAFVEPIGVPPVVRYSFEGRVFEDATSMTRKLRRHVGQPVTVIVRRRKPNSAVRVFPRRAPLL